MKKLKLRKEVKVITTLLCFGLLCTAVPTINAVAEDTGSEDSTVINDENVVEGDVAETDLYTRLMSTKTLEEFETVANTATEEEISLLSDEQNNNISDHVNLLDDHEEVVANEEVIDDSPVISEIIYPTVNFTNVAPLVDMAGMNN